MTSRGAKLFGLQCASDLLPDHMPGESSSRNASWEKLDQAPPDPVLFGRSAIMAALRLRAQKICRTNVPVLLCGESGTGKEALARWIHANSEYASGEFVKVNCAAIPGTLLESELFGYEQGAFTGATAAKPGRVEMAHHGTLFLDEIVDLDLDLQSKLLQFLQDGTFSRIGDHTERRINARLICATHKDLDLETEAGNFRRDLFYRIHGFRLNVPTLRDRREDIPALAEYFRGHFERQFGVMTAPFPPEMLYYLQNLNWPGNLRELSNGVARYVLIGPEALIRPGSNSRKSRAVPPVEGRGTPVTLKRLVKDAVRELERNVILEALRANQWNRRKTAQALKISYRALIYKIHEASLMTKKAALRKGRELDPSSGSVGQRATDELASTD